MTGGWGALRTRLPTGLEHLSVIPAFQRLRKEDFQVSEQPGSHRVLGQNELQSKVTEQNHFCLIWSSEQLSQTTAQEPEYLVH